MSTPSTKPIIGIQYLRAIAAVMVVIVHLSNYTGAGFQRLTDRFPSGVDIFFVISGFIMLVTSRRATPLSFIKHRIVRIVPLYWVLTIALFVIGTGRHRASELLKSLLFVPYLNPRAELMPLIGPGWSLNLEMYFYLLFAVLLLAPLRRRAVTILGALFLILIWFHDAMASHSQISAFYMQPRIIEFWAGMGIGSMYMSGYIVASAWMSMSAIAVGFVGLVAFDLPYQIPATLIVAGALCLERVIPRWAPLGYLGDASYSLYLIHAAVIEGCYQLWRHLHLLDAIFPVPAFIAAICAGLLCYRYLELPMVHAGRLLRMREKAPQL